MTAAGGWRPIQEAPDDDTPIFGYWRGLHRKLPVVVERSSDGRYYRADNSYYAYPTHFMLIEPVPEGE